MQRPAISIIIPVYNSENYLKQCLNSILNQSFKDFEIICIDDGSTDNSFAILKEYESNNFQIIRQSNLGAACARNSGLKIARGKYVQFLDSDDYFEPEMLEILYNTAEKFQSDLTVCSARKVDTDGNIIENKNPLWPIHLDSAPFNIPFSCKDYPKEILNFFCVAPWNKLFLKEMIVKNNIEFQNLSSCNDIAFGNIAKICAKRIIIINNVLVNYRYKRPGNISEKRASRAINVIHAAICVQDFFKKNGFWNEFEYAYTSCFTNHIRSEISSCTLEEYAKFKKEFQLIMPEGIKIFKSALRPDYITPEYMKKIIGDKKVFLWGASVFIRNVFKNEKEINPNILGFIDRNTALQGKDCGNYKVYPPEILYKIKPDGIILTVLSNNETVYLALKKELNNKFPDIKLLPNIFESENDL